MINQIFIEKLLNNIDIVDIIKKYIFLKKKGCNYVGLCPFHNEKKPSFTINQLKQFYYCFGCGANGNVINFLIKFSNLSFFEVIKNLTKNTGLSITNNENYTLHKKNIKKKIENNKIFEILNISNKFYKKQLFNSEIAKIYLKKRGLNNEIINKFEIGYSPNIWKGLCYTLSNYSLKLLFKSGLIINKKYDNINNKFYDRFRGRIMFPIKNYEGKIVAFGGRSIIKNDNIVKYINSSETFFFKKGNELYGLYEAKNEIKKKGYVLVTEGYMDVLTLNQFGFTNTVAILGSTCTKIHIKRLFSQTNNIIFSFDGDNSGRLTTYKVLNECIKFILDEKIIKFIFLPNGYDPDNYIRKKGKKNFYLNIQNAITLSKLLITEIINGNNLTTLEGRVNVQLRAKKIIKIMPKSLFKSQIIFYLSKIINIKNIFSINNQSYQRNILNIKNSKSYLNISYHLLSILLLYPILLKQINSNVLNMIKNQLPKTYNLLLEIIKIYNNERNEYIFLNKIKEILYKKKLDFLISEDNIKLKSKLSILKKEINDIIIQIKIKQIDKNINKLVSQKIKDKFYKEKYIKLINKKKNIKFFTKNIQ